MENATPAQLSLLAIYNPSLAQKDEELHEQIVYYYSPKIAKARRESRRLSSELREQQLKDERNEKLRQIGLAQGIVEFAKSFSDGQSVDAVESEKTKTIMHELETGWWLLASVDLTRIETRPQPAKSSSMKASSKESSPSGPKIEYSAREVRPASLLLQQLLRAHSIFLLHHGASLSDLYVRLTREKFCAALERFWSKFIRDWDVLLHGNPAVDIFNGLKLATGGELGMGVGEEEWGSGEREVLEGFIHRTEGLIDVVVSRFGDIRRPKTGKEGDQWLGSHSALAVSDGVIFSGTGATAKESLKRVAAWMEWLYEYGPNTYGAHDNPLSARRKRRRKAQNQKSEVKEQSESPARKIKAVVADENQKVEAAVAGIPPPIVTANPSPQSSQLQVPKVRSSGSSTPASKESASYGVDSDLLLKYATLGIYGSSWGIPSRKQTPTPDIKVTKTGDNAAHEVLEKRPSAGDPPTLEKPRDNSEHQDGGYFLVGLQGDLDEEVISEQEQEEQSDSSSVESRIMIRALHVELTPKPALEPSTMESSTAPTSTQPSEATHRLRVLVYVHRPFMFTFLFEPQTPSLTIPAFYKSLHHQLGPLQRPLLLSTSPVRVSERLAQHVSPKTVVPSETPQPIYDLVYDPANMTVHSTIPPIPDPGTAAAEGLVSSNQGIDWNRVEALSVHTQILSTFDATRRKHSELERTSKTSRGWWVVWMRLPASAESGSGEGQAMAGGTAQRSRGYLYREAVLIRKASDYAPGQGRKISLGFGSSSGNGWSGAGKLAEGIGVDARRYIEGLLSLNR